MMFDFKNFGGFILSAVITAGGTFLTHAHPEWAMWLVPLVGFLTHHSGKSAGENGGNGTSA
jgi:hypothetical protein